MASYTAGTNDAMISYVDGSWTTCRNAGTGEALDGTATTHIVSSRYISTTYYLYRYMLTFGTSTIPDTAIVSAASLQLWQSGRAGAGVTWYCFEWTEGSTATTADYDAFGTTLFGSVAADETSVWQTITFNSDGRNDGVNLTGNTDLFIRDGADYNNSPPVDATSSTLRTGNYADYEPILNVTYYLGDDSQHYSEIFMTEASAHYSYIDLIEENIHYSEIYLYEDSQHYSEIDLIEESTHYSEIIMAALGDTQHYSEIYMGIQSLHYSQIDMIEESTHYSEIYLYEESIHYSYIDMIEESTHYSYIDMIEESIHYSYIDMIEESTHYSEINMYAESVHYSYIDLIEKSAHYSQIVAFGVEDSAHYSEMFMGIQSVHYSYIDLIEESTHYSEIIMAVLGDSQHYSEINLIVDDAHYSQINMLLIDPAEYPVTAGTGDGMVEKVHADWSTAWNASTGDSADSLSTTHMVGGIYSGGNYYIRRYMAYFNTAPIPDNALITHVELDIYVHGKAGTGVTWYCTAWTDGFPVTVDDYDGFGTILFGSVAATSNGWKTMVFNKDGENHIKLTEDTELFLRGEHDYNNDTPADATSSTLRTGRYTDYQPILTVSYYLINDSAHYSQIGLIKGSAHDSKIDLWLESTHHSYIDLWTESTHLTQITMTSIGDSQHYSEIFINVESTHYSKVYVDGYDSAHYSEIHIITFGSTTQITNKQFIFNELVTVLPRWLQPEEGMNDQTIMQTLSEEMFLLIEFAEYVRDLSDIENMRMYSGSGDLTRNEALDDWAKLLNRERALWETDEEFRIRMNDYAETYHEAGTLYRYRDAIDDFFELVGSQTDIKMWEPMNTNAIASQSLFVNNHDYVSYFDSHPEHFIYCPNGNEKQRVKYFWADEAASGDGQWYPFIIPDARNFATVALTIPTTESSSLSGASGTTEGIEYDKSNTPFIRIIDTASGDLADGVYYNPAGDQYFVWDVLGMEDNFAFRLTDRKDVLPYDVNTFVFFIDTDESIHYSKIEMTT